MTRSGLILTIIGKSGCDNLGVQSYDRISIQTRYGPTLIELTERGLGIVAVVTRSAAVTTASRLHVPVSDEISPQKQSTYSSRSGGSSASSSNGRVTLTVTIVLVTLAVVVVLTTLAVVLVPLAIVVLVPLAVLVGVTYGQMSHDAGWQIHNL